MNTPDKFELMSGFPKEQLDYRITPHSLYLIKARQSAIYLKNIISHPIQGYFLPRVSSGPGVQNFDSWKWTPADNDTPSKTIEIEVTSGLTFEPLIREEAICFVANPEALYFPKRRRWLAIGDSLTANGTYIALTLEILQTLSPHLAIDLMGTCRGQGAYQFIAHEGYPGWCWKAFFTGQPPQFAAVSPFLFPEEERSFFDFQHYLLTHFGGETPDYITIFLGANDVFGIAKDYHYSKIKECCNTALMMVDRIRKAAPDALIGLLLPPPPSGQDGFGANYGTSASEWSYRRVLQIYQREMLHLFDARENEGIYIISSHLAFDSQIGYPKLDARFSNALHPIQAGYRTFAEGVAAWILHVSAKGNEAITETTSVAKA